MTAGETVVAVLGCGRMGRRHVAAAAAARDVRLTVVCDAEPGRASAVAPDGVEAVDSVQALLARRDVDAVVIAAPTPLHVQLARACLEVGKHVLVEKPVGLAPAEIDELGGVADALGLVLAVGYWRRQAWPYREAAELLAEGVIGEPRLIRACQWDAAPPPPSFCDPAVSGGIEVDCGVHELDVIAWLLDSPIRSVAVAGTPSEPALAATGDVEGACALVTTLAGQAATIDLARSVGYDDDVRTEVVGSHGALLIGATAAGDLRLGTAAGLRSITGPDVDVLDDALARQLSAFGAAARGGTDPQIVTAKAAARTLRAALAMREARLSSLPQSVPATP